MPLGYFQISAVKVQLPEAIILSTKGQVRLVAVRTYEIVTLMCAVNVPVSMVFRALCPVYPSRVSD